MFTSADELLTYVTDEDVEFIDVRFCDLLGSHAALHGSDVVVRTAVFEDGLMFDGSSIRGFQAIHESDMALFPT
jgi:glutamine synthetase